MAIWAYQALAGLALAIAGFSFTARALRPHNPFPDLLLSGIHAALGGCLPFVFGFRALAFPRLRFEVTGRTKGAKFWFSYLPLRTASRCFSRCWLGRMALTEPAVPRRRRVGLTQT